MRSIRPALAVLLLAVSFLTGCYNSSDIRSEPEKLVDEATATAKTMYANPDFSKLLELSTKARAVLIVPNMLHAAFFFGGRGGNGVLLARDPATGSWSPPAFYTLGGISYGLQFGGQAQDIIIVIMTDKGLNAVMNRKATLGADVSVAAGEIGKGLNAATGIGMSSDMYAFAQTQGLFIGIALDGSVIAPRQLWNEQVYGQGARAQGILIDHAYASPIVTKLIEAMP